MQSSTAQQCLCLQRRLLRLLWGCCRGATGLRFPLPRDAEEEEEQEEEEEEPAPTKKGKKSGGKKSGGKKSGGKK